ncbi:MAG: GDP-mannose 4,6-dehydratase [Promethearchaeota archaeon]
MAKKAIITGITGQDGSYLAEFLLSKGYEVHGVIRRASTFNTQRINHIFQDPHEENRRLFLHYGDVTDVARIQQLVRDIQPDELYSLAAQSHVKVSFDLPIYTGHVTGLSTAGILEAIRVHAEKCKLYQASSSEMFGNTPPPQGEDSTFAPRSPYAAAKVYAYWMTRTYREAYGLFAVNGILFNHESPRRGETFVTRKITRAIARILSKTQEKLFLGNLSAKRDWGYAPEYVMAMWKALQCESADDYVIGTGESHSVQEFLEETCNYAGLDWKEYVEIDENYYRPTEVDALVADTRKAERLLGWTPKVKYKELVRIMLDYDMISVGLEPIGEGIELAKGLGLTWTQHRHTSE